MEKLDDRTTEIKIRVWNSNSFVHILMIPAKSKDNLEMFIKKIKMKCVKSW